MEVDEQNRKEALEAYLQALPVDILHLIFKQLDGKTVIRCRRVCRNWLTAVDSLYADSDWKIICNNNRGDLVYEYEKARSKQGLSWRGVFRALNSWSNIASSEMTSQMLCKGEMNTFKVLPNGIVAVLFNFRHRDDIQDSDTDSDTIVYYNTDTLEECNREIFDFTFGQYDENNDFIIVSIFVLEDVHCHRRLCFIHKENKHKYIVKHNNQPISLEYFKLVGNEVYFWDYHGNFYVSKLKQPVTEKISFKAVRANSKQDMTISLKDGKKHLLFHDNGKVNLYILKDKNMEWVKEVNVDNARLKNDGFDWRSKEYISWLKIHRTSIRKIIPVYYSHGMTFITKTTFGKTIQIYYIPDVPRDLQDILSKNPLRMINMEDILPDFSFNSQLSIKSIDIVETETDHKVLILSQTSLLVLKFPIGVYEKEG